MIYVLKVFRDKAVRAVARLPGCVWMMNVARANFPTKTRFQFTLARLLTVVLLASLVFGWISMRLRAAATDKRSAAAIEKRGGDVWCYPGYMRTSETLCEWLLRRCVGDDKAGTVRRVSLPIVQLDDRVLNEVSAFHDLEELWLPGLVLRNAKDIERLGRLRRVKLLSIWKVEFNEEVIANLPKLSHLDVLYLPWHHGLSDAELDQLKELLPNTEVTYRVVRY